MADDVPEAVLAVYDKLAAVAEQVYDSQEVAVADGAPEAEQVCDSQEVAVADGVPEAVVAGRNA